MSQYLDSTVGIIKWANHPSNQDAVVVRLLKSAGAIPFAKTNVPQTMMTFECSNPLWGRTINPHAVAKRSSLAYSPGGSSGGEAALLSSSGSLVGIGSDIAGSLRIPAHFCGIYALKPSVGRISYHGCRSFRPAPFLLHPVNGPMGHCVDDLQAICTVLFGHGDGVAVGTAFNHAEYSRQGPLRIGIMRYDGFVHPMPACERAIDEAARVLKLAGHQVKIDAFDFPFDPIEMIAIFYGLVTSDGGHGYIEALKDEPIDESVRLFAAGIHLHPLLHQCINWIAGFVLQDPRLLAIVRNMGVKSVSEVIQLQGKRLDMEQKLVEYWRELDFDLLLAPVNALPATAYGAFKDVNFAASYTLVWNLFDHPSGVVPVVLVDPEKDGLHDESATKTRSMLPALLRPDCLDLNLAKHYDANDMSGFPIGVQIVGMKDCDEVVLRGMRELENALKLHGTSIKTQKGF